LGVTGQFAVDAMGAALMISEFARRHIARQATWGRIIGLTSGGDLGFPEEVSYGAAQAAQAPTSSRCGDRGRRCGGPGG
jgi:NAD(P)-dependent dehydrogenase (short-subunit alcohol dehydrogenase family)